jgi:cell division protein ZapA (FtsZ GTPase activity inhibitor)
MAYKISKDSEAELRRAVNNFNSKVKRLESVDREIDIPEKASITAIKDRVTNKWELNREIDKLERFTQRNAEDLIKNKSGVVLSRWEFENIQREQRRLSARLLREIERYGKIKPSEFGEKQALSYAQMGDDKLFNLKSRYKAISNKNIKNINRDQLSKLIGYINTTNANYRSTKKEIFYDNFIDGTLLNLGYIIGYDKDKINHIKDKLNELTPDQFIKAFNSELSLRYIQDKNVSPDKSKPAEEQQLTEKQISQLTDDLTPVLDELYENIDTIVDSYK